MDKVMHRINIHNFLKQLIDSCKVIIRCNILFFGNKFKSLSLYILAMIYKHIPKRFCFTNKIKVSFSIQNQSNLQPKQNQIPKQLLDSEQFSNQKVARLISLIKKAKHPIFFTGAGISTSIGIPDYRSHHNTIVKTGTGLWNRSQQQLTTMHQSKKRIESLVDKAVPSLSHMAIYTLIKHNIFKYVVSQNTDGLHLRSGIKKHFLSQLHGNRNLQKCKNCQKQYLRDFRTLKATHKQFRPGQVREHVTGRKCQNCNGDLHDSIVYFGQKLPKSQLMSAYNEASKSDLCVVVGSSLTVKPSSNIPLFPLKYQADGKLCIINIQDTPLDQYSQIRIHGFCDQIMFKMMEGLNIQIEPHQINHYFQVQVLERQDKKTIKLVQKDQNFNNCTFIKRASLFIDNFEKQIIQNDIQCQNNKSSSIYFQSLKIKQHSLKQTQDYIKLQFYGEKHPFRLYFKQLKDECNHFKFKIYSKNGSSWRLQHL